MHVIHPGWANGFVELGRAAADQGNAELALQSFNQAVTLAPDKYRSYAARGRYYAETGRLAESQADLDQALSLNPDDIDTLVLRWRVHSQQGQADAALGDYRCNRRAAIQRYIDGGDRANI